MKNYLLLNFIFTVWLFLFFVTGVQAQEYSIEEIPVSGVYHHVTAKSINNNGVVAGTADASPWYGYYRGFIYEDGVTNFIYLSGADRNPLLSINDNDNYVGQADFPNYVYKGFFNSQFLPPAFGDDSYAYDINNANHICSAGWDGTTDQIVIYEGTQIIHISDIGFDYGVSVKAINDSGFVTGTKWEEDEGYPFLYNYKTSQITYLPNIFGGNDYPETDAYDINNSNQIVGYYSDGDNTWGGFIWKNNNYTTFPYSEVNAINDSGVVVGESDYTPGTSGGNYAFIYDPVHGFRDLNNLIPSGTGWELLAAVDINDFGQIVGVGKLNGDLPKSFILTPNKLTITQPSAGELFIAGETDTIKWIGGGDIDSVVIWLSTDYENGSGTFKLIEDSISADVGEYVWDIPDSILSRKCAIMIEDADDPNTFAESGVFKIKGYVLTRINSNNDYEKFTLGKDDWKFNNRSSNMWPQSWWKQFDYFNGIDPYTGEKYPIDFTFARPEDFSDWPLFVSVFEFENCYWDAQPPVYKSSALLRWGSIKGNWKGSCFGFAIGCFLAFDNKTTFINRFPDMGNFNYLNQLSINDTTRYVINHLFQYQFGLSQQQYWKASNNKTAVETLNEIKEMLLNENRDDKIIGFVRKQGGHAVNPYKVVKGPQSIEYVYVYDNNSPGDTTLKFIINKNDNVWQYSVGDASRYTNNFQLMEPVSSYLNSPSLPNSLQKYFSANQTDNMEFYNTPNLSISIRDEFGNTIGYSLSDSTLINSMQNAYPIIPLSGYYSSPIGYNLPAGKYSITSSNYQDTIFQFTAFRDSLIFRFERTNALSNHTDKIFVTDEISYLNPDNDTKRINLETILKSDNNEKVFNILDLEQQHNDSLKLTTLNHEDLKLSNFGSGKSYDVRLISASQQGELRFEHKGINLEANSSHQIMPAWNDLQKQHLNILVDNGNDGTVDDSMLVENQATDVKDESYLGIPNKYYLAQNYPNPFNPLTTIRFGVPKTSFVTLKVYDILGREVETLVNEEKSAGSYEVKLNAAGLASGIYFCKMQAGDYSATKKLILIK